MNIKCIIICLLLPFVIFGQGTKKDSIYVANWNVENLYDTLKDSLKKDIDFLPDSPKEWNYSRLEYKLDHLARVINYMNNGCAPDIIGLEEVENISVVKSLIYKLRGRDYIVCHRNSPDEHGLDVALIYDRSVFAIDSLAAIHVELPDHHPTRDILHVVLIHKNNGEKFHVYVNHWQARDRTGKNIEAAAQVLKSSLDTLYRTAPNGNVIVLGDFIENPDNKYIVNILNAHDFECNKKTIQADELYNLAAKKSADGEGSFLYRSKWMMFDQIMISPSLLENKKWEYDCGSFRVIKPPFMIDPKSKKGKSLPTYRGNEYIGGYSDHYPVGAKFYLKGN